MKKNILTHVSGWYLLMLLIHPAYGQSIREGQVIDAETEETLPFANVLTNKRNKYGVTSDLNGNFVLALPDEADSIWVSYIGYEEKGFAIKDLPAQGKWILPLKAADLQTELVTIEASRDPVTALMRKVIANRKRNNPERLRDYQCEIYNKTSVDWIVDDMDNIEEDTTITEQRKAMISQGLMMLESVSERRFVKGKVEEVITGTKVSGFQQPQFASLATDLQPFAFYDNIIPIVDRNFINPIGNNALNKYDYSLEDTLYTDLDTVYLVKFGPQEGATFEALEGVLYISTRYYGLRNVLAQPVEQLMLEIDIEQMYTCVGDTQWFPQALNFEARLPQFPEPDLGIVGSGRSYIRNVQLNTGLKAKELGVDAVRLAKEAPLQDDSFWEKERSEALSEREQKTYQLVDSLGKEIDLDRIITAADRVGRGRLPLGDSDLFELDVNRIIRFNRYENIRLGLGLFTTEKLTGPLTLGAYAGYSFGDRRWQYGGSAELELNRQKEINLGASYIKDLLEPGQSLLEEGASLANLRSYVTNRMDRLKRWEFWGQFRALKYALVRLSFQDQRRKPTYDYRWTLESSGRTFRYATAGIRVRYAFREKLIQVLGRRVSQGSKFPILTVSYQRGLGEEGLGDLSFDKVEGELEYRLVSAELGRTDLRVRAGRIWGDVPLPILFHGAGIRSQSTILFIPNYFQTMRLYEFLSDSYVSANLIQDLGEPLYRSEASRPQLRFIQSALWGELDNVERHQGVGFETPSRGYFESGLIMEEVIRWKFAEFAYLNLGGGVFYRYGVYQQPSGSDNFVVRFVIGLGSG